MMNGMQGVYSLIGHRLSYMDQDKGCLWYYDIGEKLVKNYYGGALSGEKHSGRRAWFTPEQFLLELYTHCNIPFVDRNGERRFSFLKKHKLDSIFDYDIVRYLRITHGVDPFGIKTWYQFDDEPITYDELEQMYSNRDTREDIFRRIREECL